MKKFISALKKKQARINIDNKALNKEAKDEEEMGGNVKVEQLKKDLKVVNLALSEAKSVKIKNEENKIKTQKRIEELKLEFDENSCILRLREEERKQQEDCDQGEELRKQDLK